jgi:hypothetical protein
LLETHFTCSVAPCFIKEWTCSVNNDFHKDSAYCLWKPLQGTELQNNFVFSCWIICSLSVRLWINGLLFKPCPMFLVMLKMFATS